MVALRHPLPRQLYLLPPLPVPTEAELHRLDWYLSRMFYGDALLCGAYALERQSIEDSYVEWILYHHERVIGVAEVRVHRESRQGRVIAADIRYQLARLLLTHHNWQVRELRAVPYGAITPERACFWRVPRLIAKG